MCCDFASFLHSIKHARTYPIEFFDTIQASLALALSEQIILAPGAQHLVTCKDLKCNIRCVAHDYKPVFVR